MRSIKGSRPRAVSPPAPRGEEARGDFKLLSRHLRSFYKSGSSGSARPCAQRNTTIIIRAYRISRNFSRTASFKFTLPFMDFDAFRALYREEALLLLLSRSARVNSYRYLLSSIIKIQLEGSLYTNRKRTILSRFAGIYVP